MVKTYTEEAAERAARANKQAGHDRLRRFGCLSIVLAVFVLPQLWRLGGWVTKEGVPAANNAWKAAAEKLVVAPQPEKQRDNAAEVQPKVKESRQQLEVQERALLHKKDMLKQGIPYHEKEIARLRERKVEWSRRYDDTLRRKDFGSANQMMFDGSKYETQISKQEIKISDIRGEINAVDKELEEVYKKLLQAK